jgi:hypothetical protein
MTQTETRRQYRATKTWSARKVARFGASDESREDARAVRSKMDVQSKQDERSESRKIYNSQYIHCSKQTEQSKYQRKTVDIF